jgi:uncharacterized UPF0160 family protein
MEIEKFDKNELVIVTHSGGFHTDDIFAVATLLLVFEDKYKIRVLRTRDKDQIEKADFVVDVGMVYDKDRNRFDHHQGSAGARENGMPYASFGLVWEKYGGYLSGSENVALSIDSTLVSSIDARDNGIDIVKPINKWNINDFSFVNIVWIFRSTWKEDSYVMDNNFMYLVDLAKNIIKRNIIFIKDNLEGDSLMKEIYTKSTDKRLLILDKEYKFEEFVSINKDILLVIFYRVSDDTWSIESGRDDFLSFKQRLLFPEKWAGKRDGELEKETDIKGSIFCHKGRFLFVTKTKEQAIQIAKKVIPDLNI